MKYWQKTLSTIIIVWCLFIGVMYLAANAILGNSFLALEEKDVREAVQRATNAIAQELETLDSKAGDWANWDDAYQFALDANPQFVQDNVTNTSFVQLHLNLIVFLDPSGKIIFARAFDLEYQRPVPVPASLEAYVSDPRARELYLQTASRKTDLTGILSLPEGPLLFAARPILTSNGTGPSHGTLIFGRYLDARKIEEIEHTTQLALTSVRYDDPAMPDNFQRARSALHESSSIHVEPTGPANIAGYTFLNDLFGQPAVILAMDASRDIYQHGQTAIGYFLWSLVTIGLVFAVVSQVGATRLEASRQRQLVSEQKFRHLVEQSIDGIVLVDHRGKIVEWNRGQEEITGIRRAEVIGKPMWEANFRLHFPERETPEERAQFVKMIQQALETGQAPWMGRVLTEQILRPDGARRMVEVLVYPLQTETGFMLGNVTRDVTERERAREEIESLARFTSEDPNPVLRIAPDANLMYANPAAAQLLGPPENHTLIRGEWEKVISNGGSKSPTEIEQPIFGRTFNWRFAPVPQRGYFNVYGTDITKRKRAEAEREQFFRQEKMRREELSVLYALSRQLADTMDADTILDLVVRSAVETIHTTFARMVMLEGDKLAARSTYPARALGDDLGASQPEPQSAYPCCQELFHQRAPVLVRSDDPKLQGPERALFLADLVQWLCLVPVRVGDTPIGMLVLGEARREERERFTPEKIYLAQSIADQAASALQRAQLFRELEESYLQTVLSLARAVEAKDTYTADHAERLSEMALEIGQQLGMSAHEIDDLRYGAVLHDIGKIGVPDAVLLKPAKLDASDWKQMRQHPVIGAEILAPIPRLAGAAQIVRHHHERYDGKGYPDGLAGEAIPLGARILTVVDSFSAITDARVYKAARSVQDAIAELKKNAGTQFDPQIVDIFLELLAKTGAAEHGTGKMAFAEWTDEMSVGIAAMDFQHQKLVSYINQLAEAMMTGQGKTTLGTVLNQLVEYTQTHFAAEERLMMENGYPEYSTHRLEHDRFTRKVADFQSQFSQGKIALSIEVMDFMRDWLLNHIQGTDKRYGQYLAAQASRIEPAYLI